MNLNICLDLGNAVKLDEEEKTIKTVGLTSINDFKKNNLIKEFYPKVKNMIFKKNDNVMQGFDEFLHITDDINNKTEKENRKYEDVFKPKKIIITKILIIICYH